MWSSRPTLVVVSAAALMSSKCSSIQSPNVAGVQRVVEVEHRRALHEVVDDGRAHAAGLGQQAHTAAVAGESISQLFDRHLARTGLPRVRFHDLRHTHASLLVAAGTPIKVVSERLGHAHPGFTMATYQHLVPGMSADAAARFADLIATA